MPYQEQILRLWAAIDQQNWADLPAFFAPQAIICWPNTNERFTVAEYVRANSEYPGDWRIAVERLEAVENTLVSVARVTLTKADLCFHAVSFFTFAEEKIVSLTEYWSEDSAPPAWRTALGIGKTIYD